MVECNKSYLGVAVKKTLRREEQICRVTETFLTSEQFPILHHLYLKGALHIPRLTSVNEP